VALLLGESTDGTAAKRPFQATQIGSLLPARSRLSGKKTGLYLLQKPTRGLAKGCQRDLAADSSAASLLRNGRNRGRSNLRRPQSKTP
jgi:hypothetical protein